MKIASCLDAVLVCLRAGEVLEANIQIFSP